MQEIIGEKVSIVMIYDRTRASVMPVRMKWQGKYYPISTLGYHHKYKKGTTLIHIFSVSNDSMAFRLALDTDTLYWTLEEVSDGM